MSFNVELSTVLDPSRVLILETSKKMDALKVFK